MICSFYVPIRDSDREQKRNKMKSNIASEIFRWGFRGAIPAASEKG